MSFKLELRKLKKIRIEQYNYIFGIYKEILELKRISKENNLDKKIKERIAIYLEIRSRINSLPSHNLKDFHILENSKEIKDVSKIVEIIIKSQKQLKISIEKTKEWKVIDDKENMELIDMYIKKDNKDGTDYSKHIDTIEYRMRGYTEITNKNISKYIKICLTMEE